ncbi:hypothetical protein [Allofournierella sp.]|uniref:hypothetical protein n=1 Tax=Allofournierella sp. TaxID=1940256 RepID=UPI003AB1BDAC
MMNKEYQGYEYPDHHEDQNSISEVDTPEPHQPGYTPPRADGLVEEADAIYEGLGMGAYYLSLYEDEHPTAAENCGCASKGKHKVQPLGPDQCGPDQCGCGTGEEPLE